VASGVALFAIGGAFGLYRDEGTQGTEFAITFAIVLAIWVVLAVWILGWGRHPKRSDD
jgi:hypothetical protein